MHCRWVTLGTAGFTPTKSSLNSLAISSTDTPILAYLDNSDSRLSATIYDSVSNAWSGAYVSSGAAGYPSLAINAAGTPYVAFMDGANSRRLSVKQYIDATFGWVLIGDAGSMSPASPQGVVSVSLAINPTTGLHYVAYFDSYFQTTTIIKWTGSAWAAVGSTGFAPTLTTTHTVDLAFDAAGVPYVAYRDNSADGKATVKKYTGGGATGWEVVGFSALPVLDAYTDVLSLAIAPNGTPYVAIVSDDGSVNLFPASVYRFSLGTGWALVGDLGLSGEATDALYINLALDASSTPYVAFSNNLGIPTVIKFVNNAWARRHRRNLAGSGELRQPGPGRLRHSLRGVPRFNCISRQGDRQDIPTLSPRAWLAPAWPALPPARPACPPPPHTHHSKFARNCPVRHPLTISCRLQPATNYSCPASS